VTYDLRLTSAAREDLRRILQYLNQQDSRIEDLAWLAIEQTLERIGRTPFAYQSLHREAHRAIVPRFRFSIWYRLFHREIVVFAVLHGRRDPATAFRRFPD
jgi:plasmid stabilization system protein ParE